VTDTPNFTPNLPSSEFQSADPLLQSLFADAEETLDGGQFNAAVAVKTRYSKYRMLGVAGLLALLVLTVAWLAGVPLEFAQLIASVMTQSLFDLGDSWLGWAFSPVNTVGSVLVLAAKALWMLRKKIVGASYTN